MCYYSTLHINCIALSEKRPKFLFKVEKYCNAVCNDGDDNKMRGM